MADEPGDEPPAKTQHNEHVKAFFLDLARQGKETWNVWRRDPANEDVRVTFAGIDFSEAPRDGIDFSGFEFGDDADFSHSKWGGGAFTRGRARFDGAAFGNHASFTGAAFGDNARFDGAAFGIDATFAHAAFGEKVNFSDATFGEGANFIGAVFHSRAGFDGANFGYEARFTGAAFGDAASFRRAVFGSEAKFTGAAFGNWAQFVDTKFGNRAKFVGASFGNEPTFVGASFGSNADFAGAAFGHTAAFYNSVFKGSVNFAAQSEKQWMKMLENLPAMGEQALKVIKGRITETLSGPDRFLTISFASAQFYGEGNFSGRIFERGAIFTNARFYSPPNFDGAANSARVDFTGAHFRFVPPGKLLHWTDVGLVPLRLRALRKVAEETNNHDLERDLYIEERKAERGVYRGQLLEELKEATKWQKSLIRWRLFTHWLWIAVMAVYWALADYGRNFLVPAMWLGLSVPFFYWRYSVAQNLFSITCVFFIGLALRNYFRIK